MSKSVGPGLKLRVEVEPGFLLGQLCSIVDLDGPMFLQRDRTPGVRYLNGKVSASEVPWGHPLR